ncbi:MAG: acetoacetate decarboxylase family protein [Actinomycetota bacterium]
MAKLNGFFYPRTPTGAAGVVPPPPWHYSGEMLTVEFRTDPANVAELLPDGLELADEDPGAVALIWAEWQSCTDGGEELLDPARSQYKEVFLVVRCRHDDRTWSRAAYIWVDKDFAMARGHVQGYPKKMGEIWMTRPVLFGRAGPRLTLGPDGPTLDPGARFGATVSTWGRRIAEATLTITGTADTAGFVNGHPMLHSRQVPAIEADGRDSLDELVTMSGHDVELGPVFAGDAELTLFDAPTEELARLNPDEIIGGYWRQIGNSMAGGTTVRAEHNPMATTKEDG